MNKEIKELKIYNIILPSDYLKTCIDLVRSKKHLSNLPKEFILNNIRIYFEQNFKQREKLLDTKSKQNKELIKFIRAKARNIFEIFEISDNSKRKELIDNKKYLELLQTHLSTKERAEYYDEIYSKIKEIIPDAKVFLDISCAMNPFSIIFLEKYFDIKKYICTQFSEKDDEIVSYFFNSFSKIDYDSKVIDLTIQEKELSDFECDVAFLFKVLDVIEEQKLNHTYKILKSINAKIIITSFPLKNIKNQEMRFKNRPWFERMCKNLELNYKTFNTENELFYLVYKN